MKKAVVISLGGSLIIPDKIDYAFINEFRKEILNQSKKYIFVIVCGGGARARRYMSIERKRRKSKKEVALAGMKATRENAEIMMNAIKNSNKLLPKSMEDVKKMLKKHNIVFCGALRYTKDETTDATAAKIAREFKTIFINLTDVSGLYTSDPKKYKTAKLIKKIRWKKFEEMAKKIKFYLGQHFVLDQKAAKIIKDAKIKTYIIGKDMKHFNNLLNRRKFVGTIIQDE